MRPEKIKICHIQLLPLMSGVQRSMLDIFRQLDQDRYDISVICKNEGDLTDVLRRKNIHVILVNRLERDINLLNDLATFFHFLRIFRNSKFDIVHTHSSKTGFLGRWAAFFAGCPIIFHTVHGFPFHEFSGKLKARIFKFLEWLGALVSTYVIFVNNEEREFAIKHQIVSYKKAVTVYNGVDHKLIQRYATDDSRKKIRVKWNIAPEQYIVGFVGRLWEQKDPQTLYKVIKECHDLPLTFVILGDGPFRSLFEDESLHLIFEGWVDNPMQYYPAIDILIQPSLWEGLSMTLIEAMSFGKPVVASNIKGNRECVTHGKNGYLCEPRNAKSFKDAICSIITSKKLYEEMSINAINTARTYFDVDLNFSKLAELYENTIERTVYVKNI